MARRNIAVGGLTLALALLLFAPAGDAQTPSRQWNRNLPGPAQSGSPPPPVRNAPRLPEYYLERGGAVAVPRAPVGPNGITDSLQARGFRDIAPVQKRGNTLIVPHATGPSGEKVQLVIGPNGDILGVRVLGSGNR